MAGKLSNRASWDWFCRLLEPWPESHQIELPGTGFVDFWSHGRKVIKSRLLELVLVTSWANAEKSLNRVSWDSFCLYRFTTPAQFYIRKHFVMGSLFIGSPVCGSSAYSPSRRGTHKKYVSTQKYFHYTLSAAADTSHTLL